MADIELVIKISEEEYEYCKAWELMSPIAKAIVKSTPLPKGHGDLIDAHELVKGRVSNDPTVILAKHAEVIIEADTAESDG